MRSRPFEGPKLQVVKASELPLSGPALLELMAAVLARGMPFRFRARGWSMAPFIQDGDVITVSPFGRVLSGVGDVVAFARPESGNLVVHRVVAQHDGASAIRGDSVPEYPDGLIPPENLLGRVTRVERNGRSVWLGLGPERFAIAWLSRVGLLVPLRERVGALLSRMHPSRRRTSP